MQNLIGFLMMAVVAVSCGRETSVKRNPDSTGHSSSEVRGSYSPVAAPNDQQEFGTTLPLKKHPDGKLAFGVVYSLADDPDGMSWLLTYTSTLQLNDLKNLPDELSFNVWLKDSNTYLFSWEKAPKIKKASLIVNQMSVKEKADLQKLLPRQNKSVLVFADDKQKPLFNIYSGKICTDEPSYFNNLTNERKCSEITDSDVGLK